MNKILLATGAILAACELLAYEGPTFTVTAWRGEKTFAAIPDKFSNEMDGAALQGRDGAKGIAIGLYTAEVTPYTEKVHGDHLAQRIDRLEAWEKGTCASRRPNYCSVSVQATAKPGDYDFGALKVKVLDRVLPPPAEWKYYLDLWQHPWAAARLASDIVPFSADFYASADVRGVLATLAECGQKVLTTTLLDLPWNHQCFDAYHSMIGRVRKANGEWVFDYRVFDDYVAYGKACGIGPDIACYTMCPWGYVVRWQDEKGAVKSVTAKPGTPEFEDFWGAFLVDFAAHLKAKGWFEHTFIAMDERSPEDVRLISEFIRAKAPGLKISMAGNRKPSDFKGIAIDSYCQILAEVSPDFLRELDDRRANGYRTTFYVCCWPTYPNTFMTSADDEAFYLGAFPALSGFDGFLRWAANSWPNDPLANAAFGNWAPGDTFLVYPGGQYSLRLASLRAGVVVAEKLRLLKAQGLFKDEIQAAEKGCDLQAALSGKMDYGAFRAQLEALVNRP